MTSNFYQAKNAVVISFSAFSGGKFLTNCLSLSKHACPQNPDAAEYLLTHPDDYEYRLNCVLKTIPDKSQMKEWRLFEFGDKQLYGDAANNWRNGDCQCLPNEITQKLCKSNLKFFLTDNSMISNNLLTVWRNASVIKLINTEKFQLIAATKKYKKIDDQSDLCGNYCRQKYNLLKGHSWPTWQEFENAGHDISRFQSVELAIQREIEQFYPLQIAKNHILFNVDECIFDTDKFLNSMKQLYKQMNFDDFQPHLVKEFYTAYISLHI
jgi:hypothetical protein